MSNKINESFLEIKEVQKSTGEEITLVSTSESSVQVVPLMRLGVFRPNVKKHR